MNDPMEMCECTHNRGLHWHAAGGITECAFVGCLCQIFHPAEVSVPYSAVIGPRNCLACNCPEKDHCKGGVTHGRWRATPGVKAPANQVFVCTSRHCDSPLCCCTNYVSSPAQLGRYQRLHPGATA